MATAAGPLILLVDDEPDIRLVARVTLQQLGGFTVVEASSGPEALEIADRLQPALVVLDVMMPDMDGTAVLAALRARESTRALPVVFLTAKSMPAELERLRSLGARAVLTKPFNPATLPTVIRQLLEAVAADDAESHPGSGAPAGGERHTADVDVQAMEALWGLEGETGEDLVGELIDLFATHTREVIGRLRDQLDEGTATDAVRLGHSLKTSALTLGAGAIADLAMTLECSAKDGPVGDLLPLVDQIDALLEPTITSLRAARAALVARE